MMDRHIVRRVLRRLEFRPSCPYGRFQCLYLFPRRCRALHPCHDLSYLFLSAGPDLSGLCRLLWAFHIHLLLPLFQILMVTPFFQSKITGCFFQHPVILLRGYLLLRPRPEPLPAPIPRPRLKPLPTPIPRPVPLPTPIARPVVATQPPKPLPVPAP